jgi:hypothetical protein
MFSKFGLLLLTTGLLVCCHAPLKSQDRSFKPNEDLNLNRNGEALDKIAFLTFEVTLTDSVKDEYQFKLVKTFFTNGSLKKGIATANEVKEPRYLYYQIDGGSAKQEDYSKVPDPLKMVYEFPGENGALNKKTFVNKKGELIIRFQYEKTTKAISIFKMEPNTLTLKKVYNATL